ncbi:MAG: hypothetical protein KatS3mg105_1239 [Gemmatales bacterium]|nr:MAG: hypothetical protein KatS3mg105_1239 [Gemmatales bacterium]
MDFVGFYLGRAPDHKGRMLTDIWRWSDEKLETGHDFIHVLFPLTEYSHIFTAPVLDDAALAEFRANKTIRQNLLKSFMRMLRFFGFRLDGQKVVPADDFSEKSKNWLVIGDHNHWRITRILKCLRACNLEDYACAFYDALLDVATPENVSKETLEYWKAAVEEDADKQRIRHLILEAEEMAKLMSQAKTAEEKNRYYAALSSCVQEAFALAKFTGNESAVMRLGNIIFHCEQLKATT